MYSENCKMLMKEMKDITEGKKQYVLGLEELILSKRLYFPRSLQIPYEITSGIFQRTRKNF